MMKGTYCLIIDSKKDKMLSIGKIGQIKFRKGLYIYVGSALNGIEKRVKRHLSNVKRVHWHIDYLLGDPDFKIRTVYFLDDGKKRECDVSSMLNDFLEPVDKFGSSDCKCASHLYYCAYAKSKELECRITNGGKTGFKKLIVSDLEEGLQF